jgi:N-acetyl-anhydromuramyl-L-alanine amidase AmpD
VETEVKVKYPKSIQLKDVPLMSKGGTYKNKFPEGIIIHFTAGWQTQKPVDAIKFANKNGHRYIFISDKGEVVQQFDLSGFGSHAGVSKCPVTGRTTVSQYYVGIEVACGGRLEDADKDGQVDDTYFKTNVLPENIRTGKINGKWQKSNQGSYEKFTKAQEEALINLCVWLCKNGTNPDLIFGHDEVAPDRKNDPGLSLSMTMDEFRDLIKSKL